MRLINADVLLEKVREIRKLALDRVVETPANMPFPIYQNPAYTRYSTQADEREKFKAMIEEAPTVNALNCSEIPNNWIPCNDRLPEDDTEVLVYLFENNKSPYIAWLSDGRWYTEYFEVEREDEPVAWMPLPEPYKGEQG